VHLEADGLWAAYYVSDAGDRLIGHFDRDYRAALAHDRVALFLGAGADASTINFPPSFSAIERLFLRRRCTEEFVLRAVLDHTYDTEFEGFLRAAFDEYWWGDAGDEETSRAVAGCIARVSHTPRWRRVADDEAAACHVFVMGHLNPVLCSSWVPYFHEGDPNRSFFTCEEAHEWEAARRAAERDDDAQGSRPGPEATAVVAPPPPQPPAQEEARAPEPGYPAPGQRRPAGPSSLHAMPPRRASTPFCSFKRWLFRTCFFGEQSEREELQVPLLETSRGLGHCKEK
jgi:hypothetical protein